VHEHGDRNAMEDSGKAWFRQAGRHSRRDRAVSISAEDFPKALIAVDDLRALSEA
jgi:hypothetical protein